MDLDRALAQQCIRQREGQDERAGCAPEETPLHGEPTAQTTDRRTLCPHGRNPFPFVPFSSSDFRKDKSTN